MYLSIERCTKHGNIIVCRDNTILLGDKCCGGSWDVLGKICASAEDLREGTEELEFLEELEKQQNEL